MKIEQTTDYGQFKNIKGNRPLNNNQIKRLIQSISVKNMLQYAPIIVNEKLEIVDGQHRLAAAKEMQLPIFYVQIPGASLRDVQLLNAVSRPWRMIDFLHAYIAEGLDQYALIKTFMDETGYSLANSLGFLTKRIRLRDSSKTMDFKDGVFVIDDLKWAYDRVADIKRVNPYCNPKCVTNRRFIQAMLILLEKTNNNIDRLVERFEKRGEVLQGQLNTLEFLRELEKTYNYDMKTDIVRFF